MKTQTLTIITGGLLLAASAALYAMSVKVDVSGEGAGSASRSISTAAPPAFSVVVTSHRSTPGHSFVGVRGRPGMRSTGWKSSPPIGHGWDDIPADPRR